MIREIGKTPSISKIGYYRKESGNVTDRLSYLIKNVNELDIDILGKGKASSKQDLWDGGCEETAKYLWDSVGGQRVAIERNYMPVRWYYHVVLKWKGKYYDALDVNGVSDIMKLRYLKKK